ncbi:MAG: hypothetical protein HOD97_05990 [Candidatus Marinimicrobia bacterium]|jgi:hypothetical protein|nr:hypothetical protein [Candidatus Neomarinimicrobiota bacterium]MBT3618543.1 hypothetical protein [Candidatus Neomarinimicrobiota bacterium]MBT3828949.1 hypothetical protein [Candidatus Neomarinimicrobiota bacterium]MBT3997333.1 hypothetical protein [Candidatus Neomarinimicrobiota bacterium]MBT4281145.1 hypothetical protein [Candidatus Neomarinimicrobiota bacterium]
MERLVQAAIFAALAAGLGFALVFIPNVELVTVVIFLSGLTLGPGWGVLVGITSESIYSGMNPLGSGLAFPPLFFAQLISMGFAGLMGGLLKPFLFKKIPSLMQGITLGICGFLITFIYDSLTTLSYPITAGFDWPQTIALYISGMGMTLLHQVSNAIVFLIGIPKVTRHLVS